MGGKGLQNRRRWCNSSTGLQKIVKRFESGQQVAENQLREGDGRNPIHGSGQRDGRASAARWQRREAGRLPWLYGSSGIETRNAELGFGLKFDPFGMRKRETQVNGLGERLRKLHAACRDLAETGPFTLL